MRRHGLFTAMIENVLVDARHGFAVLYEAAYDVIGPDPDLSTVTEADLAAQDETPAQS
ncbi:MAG: hypothetical protein ABR608_00235 [Pseudonocardiaceae bacterium]